MTSGDAATIVGSSGEVSLIANDCPRLSRPGVVGAAVNAGSGCVVAELRCEARGAGEIGVTQ